MRRAYRSFTVVCATAAVLAGCLLSGAGAKVVSARGGPRAHAARVARPAHFTPRARQTHTITYDQDSLMIDGRRTVIWSGEFEYWRLPSPSLWLDILQKMKAEGYNAVTIYFDWAYHSPKSGVYDFSGVRNMDQLLDIANQVGIYVIARPGPYINAEVDSGGFPGWLQETSGTARSNNATWAGRPISSRTKSRRTLA